MHNPDKWKTDLLPKFIVTGAGLGLLISGAILNNSAAKLVEKSVKLYNDLNTRSSVDLNFDFTGNGVRLAVILR